MVSANTIFTALMGLALANMTTASITRPRAAGSQELQARADKYSTRSVMWRRGEDGALLRRKIASRGLEPRKCYHSCWRKDKQEKEKKKSKKPGKKSKKTKKLSKKIKAKKHGKKGKKDSKKEKEEKEEKEEKKEKEDKEEDSE